MKRFLKIAAVFMLPILILYGVFGLVLKNSRELAALDEVVDATVAGELTLYGSAYHENFAAYKSRVTAKLAPELLVLGTSRSMPFREEYFTGISFYNAGGGAKNAAEYLWFLQSLPQQSLPKIVLAVFDQNMFNDTWAESAWTQELSLDDVESKKDTLARVLATYGDGKFSVWDNLVPKAGVYGLAAAGRGSGFAGDGSYRYGKAAEKNLDAPESNFADTYRDIDFSNGRFAQGQTVCERSLCCVDEFLAFCYENDIIVVGILPPFAPTVWEKMQAAGGYEYLNQLPAELEKIFASYGFACYDYSYLPDTQAVQYLDGFHAGDEVYAQIALRLSQAGSALAEYVDAERITAMLSAPHNNPRELPG